MSERTRDIMRVAQLFLLAANLLVLGLVAAKMPPTIGERTKASKIENTQTRDEALRNIRNRTPLLAGHVDADISNYSPIDVNVANRAPLDVDVVTDPVSVRVQP